ncbi:polysaccharide deacetylase family protein [Luedemannella flava]
MRERTRARGRDRRAVVGRTAGPHPGPADVGDAHVDPAADLAGPGDDRRRAHARADQPAADAHRRAGHARRLCRAAAEIPQTAEAAEGRARPRGGPRRAVRAHPHRPEGRVPHHRRRVDQAPRGAAAAARAGVPVTLFLTTDAIRGNVGYFADLRDAGADIEVHTVTHPHLPDLDYDGQRAELCGNADKLKQWYGKRPLYFRPPYGEYDDDTLRAAWDCGLRAGFLWRETVDGGVVRYQTAEKVIRPGDIVLMHFRPAYPEDFIAALTAMKRSGLVPARLTDYVAPVT